MQSLTLTLTSRAFGCRAKLILLSPLALFRVLLSLVLLLSTWGFMKVVLIGAPTVTPFEPWREDLARNTIRFAGTCMLVLGAACTPLMPRAPFSCDMHPLVLPTHAGCLSNATSEYLHRLKSAGTGGLARVQGWEHTADGEAQHAPVIFNHVSYLDALILAAYFAPCGVAKVILCMFYLLHLAQCTLSGSLPVRMWLAAWGCHQLAM